MNKMIRTIFPALLMALLLPAYAGAAGIRGTAAEPADRLDPVRASASEESDFTWDEEDDTVITGLKKETVTDVVIPGKCKAIADNAFEGRTALKSVSFSQAPDLKSIGVRAFFGTGLTDLTITGSITSIGDNAFSGNDDLTVVLIDSNISELPPTSSPFEGDTLTKLTFGTKVTEISPNNTSSDGLFYGCTLNTGLTVPSSVEHIGPGAFCNSKLTGLTFAAGSQLASIGEKAFYGTKIKSVTVPKSVVSIGDQAFSGIDTLRTVTINSDISDQDNNSSPFRGARITELNFGQVTKISSNSNYNCGLLYGCIIDIPDGITIPATVKSIGPGAFCSSSLKKVNFEEGSLCTSIGARAFYRCSLSEVVLPPQTKEIGYQAFGENEDLKIVSVPSTVEKIASPAFPGDKGITDIYYGGKEEAWKDLEVSFDEGTDPEIHYERYPHGGNVDVTSVVIDPTSLYMVVGETSSLKVTVLPSDASDRTVTFESKNTDVVTVDEEGKVTAQGAGNTLITVVSNSDRTKKAMCTVTVTEPVVAVTGVEVEPGEATILIGETVALTATVEPYDAADKSVTWSSGNTGIAKVSPTGAVTGVKEGKVQITAKTKDGGFTDSCTVTVLKEPVRVTGVSVRPVKLSLLTGEVSYLTAEVVPENAADKSVTWTSGDRTVAEVSDTGEVRAKKAGKTVITVKTVDGGFEASCEVTVTDPVVRVTDVSIAPTSLYLKKGASGTLAAVITPSNATDRTVYWSVTSGEDVVSVSNTGVVKGLAEGTAEVTVRTRDGSKTARCTVTVGGGFTPPETEFTLLPGESRRIILDPNGQYLYGVRWEVVRSSPYNCVTVKNGVVTAKNLKRDPRNGEALISATHCDFGTFYFNVIVDRNVPEDKVMLDADQTFLVKPQQITANKTVNTSVGVRTNPKVTVTLPKFLYRASVKCEVVKGGVCLVYGPQYNSNGSKASFEIVPVGAGATYIMWEVTGTSGRYTRTWTKVVVKQPVTELELMQDSVSLSPGGGQYITLRDTPDNTSTANVSFTAKGKGLKVSKSGFVMATYPGVQGYVTVKAGKLRRTIPVTVGPSGSINDQGFVAFTKPSWSVTAPEVGTEKRSSVVLKTNLKKKNYISSLWNWVVDGSPEGIEIRDGKVYVSDSAVPGCYVVRASAYGYNIAECELLVK